MTNEVVDKSWQELAREAQLEREEFRCKVIEQSAAIEQLHAAVKTAQELAATRLMEIEGAHHDIDRLMAACNAEANEVERLRAKVASLDNVIDYWKARAGGSSEPLPVASRDADHCDYPDCEHHWELVIDWALAAMKKLHESAEPDTDHPEIPAIIPAGAFRAFVDEHARLMRIRASAPQGASRDASSELAKCSFCGETKIHGQNCGYFGQPVRT